MADKQRDLRLGSPVSGIHASSECIIVPKMGATTAYKPQFIASFAACFAAIAMGTVIGYTSPVMDQLTDKFGLTDQEQSLVGSLVTIGALIGGLVAGMINDYFGRKTTLLLISIPYMLGWVLILCATDVAMLYFARTLSGFGMGLTCLSCPVYITEIATPNVRGLLGSFFQLFVNVGILFAYIMGKYVTWSYLALILAFVPALQAVFMIPVPESPSWLMRNKRKLDALSSLQWLRGDGADTVSECASLERESSEENAKMSLSGFTKPLLYKPMLLTFALMIGQQYSGINAIIFNAVPIFQAATQSIDPHDAAIIVGACAVGSSLAAFALMDKAGRKILLLISAFIMAASMITMGLYYFEKSHDESVAERIWWLPVASLVIFVAAFNLGYGPVPWLMMSELFPSQARGMASSMITAFNWTMAFVVTKTFVDMQDVMYEYGTFWLFGCVCTLSFLFVITLIPETKGKTMEEIQNIFDPGRHIL